MRFYYQSVTKVCDVVSAPLIYVGQDLKVKGAKGTTNQQEG